jgi:hypothetical protein
LDDIKLQIDGVAGKRVALWLGFGFYGDLNMRIWKLCFTMKKGPVEKLF